MLDMFFMINARFLKMFDVLTAMLAALPAMLLLLIVMLPAFAEAAAAPLNESAAMSDALVEIPEELSEILLLLI